MILNVWFLLPASPARHLAFDSTGSYLCVGRSSGVLEIFDVSLSRRLTCWSFSDQPITALSFNPLYPLIAVGVDDIVYIIAVRIPSYMDSNDNLSNTHGESDPSTDIPTLWDVSAALKALNKSDSNGEPITPPVSTYDIWEQFDGSQIGSLAIGGWKIRHKSGVNHLAWHPRGLFLTTVSTNAPSPSLQVGIHSLSKLKTIRPFSKNVAGRVQRAVFHPKNNWLFIAFHRSVRYV